MKGRTVLLFPDLSKDGRAFELWSKRAKEIETRLPVNFKIFDLLEKEAPAQAKENGLDLADYLIKQDWKYFRNTL